MMSFKKIIAIGMVAATALTSSAVSMAVAPAAKVYAEDKTKVTAYYSHYSGLVFCENFEGNYITVVQYSDEAATKVKATYVIENESEFDLSNFNLKRDTYWKVYDEILGPDKVSVVKVPAQSAKVTVKLKDATADSMASMFECKGGTADLDNTSMEWYSASDIKKLAAAGGTTLYVSWSEDTKETVKIERTYKNPSGASITYFEQHNIYRPYSASTKLKIPASPKAPKVTIDYVNGTYKFPNNSEYYILSVNAEGAFSEDKINKIEVKDKAATTITIDGIFEKGETVPENGEASLEKGATQAAIYVQTAAKGKKFASVPTIIKVEKLATATYNAVKINNPGTASAAAVYTAIKDVTVKFGTVDVATFAEQTTKEKDDEGNKVDKGTGKYFIEAEEDMAYSIDDGKTWTTIKKGKKSKQPVAEDGKKIQIKKLGVKETKSAAGEYGSGAVEVVVYKDETAVDKK